MFQNRLILEPVKFRDDPKVTNRKSVFVPAVLMSSAPEQDVNLMYIRR